MSDDKIYENILTGLLHRWGPRDRDASIPDSIMLFKSTINIGEGRHVELMKEAETKIPPKISLNIEATELKGVNTKDLNGPYDPYMTVFVADSKDKVITKAVKIEKNHFSVPLEPHDDIKLILKIRKKRGFKCFRCIKKVLGKVSVELNSVPTFGLDEEYSLEKDDTDTMEVKIDEEYSLKKGDTDTIRVKINYSSDSKKDKHDAFEEHCYLLKHFLLKELQNHTSWHGKFPSNIERFLSQHQAQNGLTAVDIALIKWTVYTEMQQKKEHCFSTELFYEMLSILEDPILTNKLTFEDTEKFWESTCRLLPSYLDFIRNARENLGAPECLKSSLKLLDKLEKFKAPQNFDMFPREYYGWLRKNDKMNIHSAVKQALITSANEYFDAFIDSETLKSDDPERKVKHCIDVIEIVKFDIERWDGSTNLLFKE